MTVPIICVIIPCFNQPKFMIKALYSVLEQTIASEIYVMVVSDGGTMQSQTEWLRVASTFSNVEVLWTKNNGPGQARNIAIERLLVEYPGIEYVFFLDADNYLEPWAMETARRLLKESGRHWLYSDVHAFGVSSAHNGVTPYNPHIHLFQNYCDTGCLIHADLLRAGARFLTDRRIGYEDWGFWLTCLDLGFRGAHADDFGFRYRRRGASRVLQENRNRSIIINILHDGHKALYHFDSVKALEHTHAPRFCVIKAGDDDGYFLSDPGLPGQAYSVKDIKQRLWSFADRPDREPFPPYMVIVHPSFFDSESLARLHRDIFLRIDHELRQYPLVIGYFSFGEKTLSIQPVDDPDSCPGRVVFTAVASKLVLDCLGDRDFNRINQLISSSKTRAWAYQLQEDADFDDESDLVLFGLNACLSKISDRSLAEQVKVRWNWKTFFIRCFLPDYAGWTSCLDPYCLPDLKADGRPRIGFVINKCDFGGAAKVIFNVARQFAAAGWQTNLFIYGANAAKSSPCHLQSFENIYFFNHAFQKKGEFSEWGGDHRFRGVPIPKDMDERDRNLAAALLAMDVVVNGHNWRFNGLASDLHAQGVITATYLHVVDHTTWGQASGHPFLALAFEHAYDLIITCSQSLSDWLGAAGVPREKRCYVSNAPGYDLDRAVEFQREIPENRPLRLLYVGRLDRQKGTDRIALVQRATSEKFEWRIFGSSILDNSDSTLEDVRPAIYDEQKLQDQYAWADIMLLLSDFEGVPLGILEAQRAGCVVISTDVGAVSEAITDEVDGFLVPPEQYIKKTLELIQRLDDDRKLLVDVSGAARARAADRSWSVSTRPLIERLEELMAARGVNMKQCVSSGE